MTAARSSGDPGVVQAHEGPAALEPLAADWDALADRAAVPPWWRPGWLRAWWRAFGRGTLRVVTLRRGGRLCAVAPLERRDSDLRSTTNYHTPSFGILAEDDGARDALADWLVRAAPRSLTVAFLPRHGPTLASLTAAARAAHRPQVSRVLERCPIVPIEGTFVDYLAQRRGHMAREIRRRRRKLAERGRFEFEVRDGREDLPRLIEEGTAVEAAGWKGERGTAIGSSPATLGFYSEIASWLATRGELRLAFLRLDGKAFAFDFAIESGRRHSLLKTGYHPAFRADAPGVLLRASMIERAFEMGLERYDFLGKDDPWKREWTTLTEDQMQFQSFSLRPDAVTDWIAQRYLRPLAKRVLGRR